MNDLNSIGERIAFYRKRAKLTQEELAKRLGIAANTLSNIEQRGNTDCETLKKISEILNISSETLLYGYEPTLALTAKRPTLLQLSDVNIFDSPDMTLLSTQELQIIKILRSLSPEELNNFLESLQKTVSGENEDLDAYQKFFGNN